MGRQKCVKYLIKMEGSNKYKLVNVVQCPYIH